MFTSKFALLLIPFALAACSDRSEKTKSVVSAKAEEQLLSCKLSPIAVNVGAQLDGAFGVNGPGAFPFTKGGAEPSPGNVALSLEMNFKLAGAKPTLVSITGSTPAGDKVFLPALVERPVVYSPPAGGYSETPAHYQATGCDSVWSPQSAAAGLAIQNQDGTYKAQCATVAMDIIPAVMTMGSDGNFSADLSNPSLASFSDGGKTGWVDPNTGHILIDGKAYSRVSRGWDLAARLQEAGIAKFTAAQVPWHENKVGSISAELVKAQLDTFGATASNSGSDYTYRTDGFDPAGKWSFSHGHYSVGMPKSGPSRLSAGVAMFRVNGVIAADKRSIAITNFSYSGPMLVCPANGQECTASPGRNVVGMTCSASL